MKLPEGNPNKRKSVLAFIISLVLLTLGVTCIALHISPLKLLKHLSNYAVHHYFLVGFVFLAGSLICIKWYYSKTNPKQLSRISNKNNRLSRLLRRFNKKRDVV